MCTYIDVCECMHAGVGLFHVSIVGQKLYLSMQIVGFVVGVSFDEQISLF